MPKDPKRNVDRYKIRGGEMNEFEFQHNQAELEITKAQPGARGKREAQEPALATRKKTGKSAVKAASKSKIKKKEHSK